MNKFKVILIILMLPLLAACGGGGSMGQVVQDIPTYKGPASNYTASPITKPVTETTYTAYEAGLLEFYNDLTSGSVKRNYFDQMYDEVTTTKAIYKFLNIEGLSNAHSDGWDGTGVKIGLYDHNSHGIRVSLVTYLTAPGAEINYNGKIEDAGWIGMDITNHSYGWDERTVFDMTFWSDEAAKHFNKIDVNNPDAVHVIAGPNDNACSTNDMVTCDGAGNAFANGRLNGTYIFVGAFGNDYISSAVGSNEIIQNSFLVADGLGLKNRVGSSYAAPRVSGALALVAQKFPGTTASERKMIILESATDLGAAGIDAVYGHGLLNVGAALSPIGALQ